jgi:hypothetical protein
MNRLILKKIILHITFLLLFCCETSPGYNDIEIVEINGLTYGLLKSNNSLFTGDIIEYSRDLTGVSFNDDTGESFPEYEYYPFIEIHFENGLATGSWKWYNTKNYKIELEINYKDGNLHGVSNEWNMSGDLILVEVWDEGELIFENIY